MIHIQVIQGARSTLKAQIRRAVDSGQIKSFSISSVKGGLRIRHKKYPGAIRLSQTRGFMLGTLVCKNPNREWQLLEAFVGRLVYHFRTDIAAINVQLERATNTE